LTLRLAARILAALLALAVLAVGMLVAVGVTVDAQRWREPLAVALSRALGREVRLEGTVQLTVALRPGLAASGISIANPPGFDAPEFARVAELRVSVELLPLLLRRELRADEVLARGVTVRLERARDGRGNWAVSAAAGDAPAGPRRLSLDVYRIVLTDLRIEQVGEDATRSFELARLELEPRVGTPAPWPLRATAKPPAKGVVAAGLRVTPGRIALEAIDGTIGATRISGALAVETHGARPKLSGRLAVPELDPRALPVAAPGDAAGGDLHFERLGSLDADLALEVGRWVGLPVEVRDLVATLRIDAGRATVPFRATLAGAPVEGELAVDAVAVPPRLRARLVAREVPLGELAERVLRVPHVAGTVGRFEATLDARGRNADELVRALEARVRVDGARLTYGNYAGGAPVPVELVAAEAAQPRGGAVRGRLRGSLRGKAFDGTFRVGTVERLLRERRAPFGFDGTSGGVRARLSGTLAAPTDGTGPDIEFDVTAPYARELAPWLGFSSQSDLPVALAGTVQVRRDHTSLTGGSLRAGRTAIAGDVAWQAVDGKAFVTAKLVAELLAAAEVRTLAAPSGRATVLEIPILPEALDFADSDVEILLKRVDGLPVAITDVVLQGRMRDGAITPSPFSLRLDGNALAGAIAIDASDGVPTASLWLAGADFDLGGLLRRLRVTQDIDARIGLLRLHADLRERRLGDLLEQSSFVANMESGTFAVRGANTGAALTVAIDAGEVRAAAGAPVTATMTGTAGATAVKVTAEAGRLREFFAPAERLPFSVTAESPGAKLAISGTAVPQRVPDVALSLALTGERLNGLDDVLETSLPPWGPYALTGRLRLAKHSYELDAMRLVLGESILEGRGSLDTSRARPRLELALAAERIQLDDFPFADWSPFELPTGAAAPLTMGTARPAVAAGARRLHALFSRERLERGDGNVDLVVKEVVAGDHRLGQGRLAVTVADGHATIAPVAVESGAGNAWFALFYQPREHDVLIDAQARVDRLEYGALARVLGRRANLAGAVSLDLRLAAAAPRLSAVLTTGSGRFDFAVWPRHVTGGVFDLWAANMLFRLLPFVDSSASPLNCAVGEFDLAEGTLRSVRLTIDTVNTRTEGGGRADFATDAIQLRLVPRPKVAQFFSLATPIEVAGTFEDYRISVLPADTLGTAVRWASSPALVPLQRITDARLPADGRDVCGDPRR
jgi:uncharacterized protein involved in outer membrane biogenesis